MEKMNKGKYEGLRFFGSPNLNNGRNGFQTEKKYKLNICYRLKKKYICSVSLKIKINAILIIAYSSCPDYEITIIISLYVDCYIKLCIDSEWCVF